MGFNPFAAGGGAGGDYVHNYTTFDDLGIDTHGKTMEEILKEIADMNLPVNTIITGQLYKEAAPDERIYNCEGEIQITQGKYGQVYWCRATSASISPYSWDSIYNQTTDEDNPIDNILPWTPTYYQSTEINEIKKKLEELGADWVGRFERDENGNILGEYFNDYENNKATGLYSHTEGSMNVNLGETGHVEGYNNKLNSTEKGSHVEGMENVVEGECNHTEGRGNTVHGTQNHVSGSGNSVNGVGNFVCGIGSSDIVSNRNIDFGQGSVIKNQGDNAILCGNVNKILSGKYIADDNYDPDDTNRTGQYNAVIGNANTIYASSAYVFGASNTIGIKPTEKDPNSPNKELYSMVVGAGNQLKTEFSFITGSGNTINTSYSMIHGMNNTIENGFFNFSNGMGNHVYGGTNFTFGQSNNIGEEKISSSNNVVFGLNNTVKSDFNKIMGNGCLVKKGNQYIHILGNSNSVHSKIGVDNLIAGTSNNIYKNISFSSILGAENTIGQDEEVSTGTDYDVSHVFIAGHGLAINAGKNKTILGSYNAIDTEDKFALVIGNGTADDARSNAFAVSKTGDIYVKNSDTPIDLAPISMSLLEEICV